MWTFMCVGVYVDCIELMQMKMASIYRMAMQEDEEEDKKKYRIE